MEASHATVGIGATSGVFALTTLLTGMHGLTPEQASAAAWLIVTGLGGLYAAVAWFIQWRYPTAPALPGEMVAIPPGAPPVAVAQVPPVPPAVQTLQSPRTPLSGFP